MCLIVDNNVAHRVFSRASDPDFAPVRRGLFENGRGRALTLVYGGRLKDEYFVNADYRRLLAMLDRNGRAIRVPDEAVGQVERQLVQNGACASDDPHVIALAQVSGARVLCSHDQDLHADFTNPALLSAPRGRVYQSRQHAHLLRTCRRCASRGQAG